MRHRHRTPGQHRMKKAGENHRAMSFDKLIAKVTQAEDALEAHERRVGADLRQLKHSWKASWTPTRIMVAGVVTGFLVGRAEPLRSAARGGRDRKSTRLNSSH